MAPIQLPPQYHQFYLEISQFIPRSRLFRDPLRTLAYGTDASFYRLIPKLVVKVTNEEEVSEILKRAEKHEVSVTFRAAGTSLSGQSITDSVLVVVDRSWNRWSIHDDGELIKLQPAIIGSSANLYLKPYQKKIGPDPASINSAMIGGIAANNASGMCCGTAQNSYNTLHSMRVILSDGTILDTGSEKSKTQFSQSHGKLMDSLEALATRVQYDDTLADRIRHKFQIKNTTGYSLNALVDFTDPFEILQHLMIGSEGTLGFISEITYKTVDDHTDKATALVLFPDIETACQAVAVLKKTPVAAVELMDGNALNSIEHKSFAPDYIKGLSSEVCALLVETRAESAEQLKTQIQSIQRSLKKIDTVHPIEFTTQPEECAQLWAIRKGLFPSVGAVRKTGTTVIIEDIAFQVDKLAAATLDLQKLFAKHHYDEAVIFGHALEGNIHFVFTQDFQHPQEVKRYEDFMNDVCEMVVQRYDGSLKAEHGTGRNMAPFVEMEWGKQAYGLMQEIKDLFDPKQRLNPGVILNNNPQVHVQNLKPLPQANILVDKCIECGFCEVQCPSKNLTLTPRQRIVIWREIMNLRTSKTEPERLRLLEAQFDYDGKGTCAADGLCATSCPVDIDTGKMIKSLRSTSLSPVGQQTAKWIADHFKSMVVLARTSLTLANFAHRVLGSSLMLRWSQRVRQWSGNRIPQWTPYMPQAASKVPLRSKPPSEGEPIVYFPSCVCRMMGAAAGSPEQISVPEQVHRVLNKAGIPVIHPPQMSELCCGLMFESKGAFLAADTKLHQVYDALRKASQNGKFPILCDMSPCTYRLKQYAPSELQIHDPISFTYRFLLDKLEFSPLDETIAIHTPCSSQKMGLASQFHEIAKRCATGVFVPEGVGCCGMAGDRGFTHPELMNSALTPLRDSLPTYCRNGYSSSRTCEVGLSTNSQIHYRSLFYLIDNATESKKN